MSLCKVSVTEVLLAVQITYIIMRQFDQKLYLCSTQYNEENDRWLQQWK